MLSIADLTDWMDENTGPQVFWYVKRLSGNDTLANGTHQAGPYIPREVLFKIFPSMNRPLVENPNKWFDLRIDSHGDARNVRAVWYNSKVRNAGTRNETRLTNFGGAESALLDPESTGSLAIFAFHRGDDGDSKTCNVWVCDFEAEADLVEERIGPVEPGRWRIWTVDEQEQNFFETAPKSIASCWLEANEIPAAWLKEFPTGAEIIRKTVELRGDHDIPVDQRLLKRRQCEFEIFKSLEQAVELPMIRRGFETVDAFINRANSILQRRKSRSGRSLELHAREIFLEENLHESADFQHQPESDSGKRPDFLFPSQAAYKDANFPAHKLRMLAAKTTCKDRWRQVINEAERIETKHLLTLQEGISVGQFKEMTEAKVQLVVPLPLVQAYPKSVQPHLQTLAGFIAELQHLRVS